MTVITGQHLGLGEFERWGASHEEEFALIDIRFVKNGKGVAKVAAADEVVHNRRTKMIELGNYAAEPVRLSDVRSALSIPEVVVPRMAAHAMR